LITSAQIRAARALLRWSSADLSELSGVGNATIKRLEVMEGVPSGQVRTLMAIKEALEAAGVEFTGAPDDRPGVRLLKQVHQASTRQLEKGDYE
jgi:transcriptional regulator with XRE-family HTH domain